MGPFFILPNFPGRDQRFEVRNAHFYSERITRRLSPRGPEPPPLAIGSSGARFGPATVTASTLAAIAYAFSQPFALGAGIEALGQSSQAGDPGPGRCSG